jgi:hypothetical protein
MTAVAVVAGSVAAAMVAGTVAAAVTVAFSLLADVGPLPVIPAGAMRLCRRGHGVAEYKQDCGGR